MEKIGPEQLQSKNNVEKNVEKEESMEKKACFVCGNCEFYTDKIEDIHRETSRGVSHECPNCVSGLKQSSFEEIDELHCKLEKLHRKLEKNYKLEFLDTSYTIREDCEKCRALNKDQ